MRLGLLVVLLLSLEPALCRGETQTFPYEAVVETDTAVRSGPGDRYYTTQQLPRGTRVSVQRHDPGGWRMIAPPPQSFSLIQTSLLRASGAGAYEVVGDDVSVRVGSRLGDSREVEQLRLSQGDRVTAAAGVSAPSGWTAIAPPRGEYRWIAGQALMPTEVASKPPHRADPFATPVRTPQTALATPSQATPSQATPAQTVARAQSMAHRPTQNEQPPVMAVPQQSQPIASADGCTDDPRQSLNTLDDKLAALDDMEPTDWPLDELAAGFTRLGQDESAGLGRPIAARLAQVERLRVVQERYADYIQLTSATDRRDAELIQKRDQLAAAVATLAPPAPLRADTDARPLLPPPAPPAEADDVAPLPMPQPLPAPMPLPRPASLQTPPAHPASPAASEGPLLVIPPGMSVSATTRPAIETVLPAHVPPAPTPVPVAPAPAPHRNGVLPASATMPQPQVPPQPRARSQPQKFDAVGVIARANDPQPGLPRHVLVAANGQILVYLQEQPGIALDRFLGQAMGVDGVRQQHSESTTWLIVVRQLTPVRL